MGMLEICCGDLQSVRAAVEGGADRIELCSALSEGGLTPSYGLIASAREIAKDIKLHVLIRPREGDFVYTDEDEIACMAADVAMCAEIGADGVVIGALTPEGDIDMKLCQLLIASAEDLSVTFHRAFDRVADPAAALEKLIELGCDRVLTSGLASSALEGAEMLRSLNEQAAGRITILAGAGVTPDNGAEILARSGVKELHGSVRERVAGTASKVRMGSADDGSRMITSRSAVERLAKTVHQA